jgi:hypothetical protein
MLQVGQRRKNFERNKNKVTINNNYYVAHNSKYAVLLMLIS